MLNSLKNKLLSFFSANYLASDKLISIIFSPLQALDTALLNRISNYIIKGEDENIFLDINHYIANEDVRSFISTIGDGSIYHYQNNKGVVNSFKARKVFYTQWTHVYSFEQIIRFGKVLATLKINDFAVIPPKLPLWFVCLFTDGLITTLKFSSQNTPNMKERSNWSITQLHELLETEEKGSGQQLLFAIFDREQLNYKYGSYDYVYDFSDLLPYINQNLERFKKLPTDGLSIIGQLEQLNYINKQPELKSQLIDFIARQTLNSSKQVSKLAVAMLASLPVKLVQEQLQYLLTQGTPNQRSKSAILLARLTSDSSILENALASETNTTVIKSIETSLFNLNVSQQAEQQSLELDIPSFEPIPQVDLPLVARDILQQNYEEKLSKFNELSQQEIEENKKRQYSQTYNQYAYNQLKSITSDDLDNLFDYINGHAQLVKPILKKNLRSYFDFILDKGRLQNLPEFNLYHLLRIRRIYDPDEYEHYFTSFFYENEMLLTSDLRQISDVLTNIKYFKQPNRVIASIFMKNSNFSEDYEFEPNKLWPFFAEHSIYLDEELGLSPSEKYSYAAFNTGRAIKILQFFPQLPTKYVVYLLEVALGENKTLRDQSQALLSQLPDIHYRAEEALQSGKQEIRIIAAQWLAKLGQTTSIKPLQIALKKEKRPIVQAALLVALQNLGEDISQYLTAKKLLADAQKGLKGKKPVGFEWFDINLIPVLTWQNGEKVDPKIIYWWALLAVKLQDPANLLLLIYTHLLSETSQHQLGQFILQSFIKQDTLSPTIEDAEKEANQNAHQRWQSCLNYFKKYPKNFPSYENITLEDVFQKIKKEVLSRYLGSAIKFKGLLALASVIDGNVAVPILRSYMKEHYKRRTQIEAMLESMANSDDPLIIQLLLSIARRHRTNSVQEKAKLLINKIAERNHWSAQELADRTISTAGLNESGVLTLDYGERTFTAIVDDKFKWVLRNPEGEQIKALPEARKTEDETLVKEAKKQFSNSKKELKQLIDLQVSRLYESMCNQRQWSVSDWQKYLQAHPIMNLLIQRLIWLEVNPQNEIINSFRPTEDGCLINLDDDEITLSDKNFVRLAHCALLPEEITTKWQAHLKDYKIKPLFEQLAHHLPDLHQVKEGLINDRLGWLTDSFTLRNTITKLGYKRADIEDGGCFFAYYKYFSDSNLYICIDFSGSYVPEDNIPVVLYNLYFTKKQRGNGTAIDIKNVPPVLLAEGYANYITVANACTGFDPEWERKGLC